MMPVAHRRPPWAPHSRSAKWSRRFTTSVLAAAVLAAAAIALPASPPTLTIIVENPGERAVTVRVPSGGRAVFEDVLDSGPEWMVLLQYGAVSAGELRVSRDELRRGWAIPPAVSDHFSSRPTGDAPRALR